MLELIQLEKRFGKTRIIQGVDLHIEEGERHAVIGPNGAGKSTLFNLISRRLGASAGRILFQGEDVTMLPAHLLARRGVGRSFQVTNAFPGLSVRENLLRATMWSTGLGCGLFSFPSRNREVGARVDALLVESGLSNVATVLAGELSYADQRSLEIAMTLGIDPRLVLLDEPTAGMSKAETEGAISLIRRLTENRTLLIVEHDMNVVFSLADRISVLVRGEIVITGTPEEIRGSAIVREAYLGSKGLSLA